MYLVEMTLYHQKKLTKVKEKCTEQNIDIDTSKNVLYTEDYLWPLNSSEGSLNYCPWQATHDNGMTISVDPNKNSELPKSLCLHHSQRTLNK